jgi:hypothetical protein
MPASFKAGDRVQLKRFFTISMIGPDYLRLLHDDGWGKAVTADQIELVPAASPGKRLVEIDDAEIRALEIFKAPGYPGKKFHRESVDTDRAFVLTREEVKSLKALLARAKAGDA